MLKQLNQQKLLEILMEAQKLGESQENISSIELVKEIEKMLQFEKREKVVSS